MYRLWILFLSILLLAACSEENSFQIGLGQWKDIQVSVESRPNPVSHGMNEFLIIANKRHRRPAYDLIVSLRTSENEPWKQTIQDGHVGVYRRAVSVQDPLKDILQVQLKEGGDVGVLYFPLAPKKMPK